MAAKHCYQRGLLILLLNAIATAASEKRFSNFKRCADQECSMLLCRGKAVKDFSGPDCRFLSFKKSETVYVYYKLSGRRADLWAGSVGSNFGYFPKDLLAVNHLYTEKEHEIPAEETDFVCFDTGFDKFDNYDVDLLLASLAGENVSDDSNGTFEHIQETKSTEREPEPSAEQVTQSEQLTEHHEGLDKVHEDQSTTLPELDTSIEDLESNTKAVPDDAGEGKNKQTLELESVFENGSERSETEDAPTESEVDSVPKGDLVNEPVSISEGREIPEFKTTFGTTFDAVTSDDEITTKVTPYEEEDGEDVDDHPEDVIDDEEEIPLLSSAEETVDAAASDSLPQHESIPITENDDGDKPKMTEEKNMWTSLGDAVFSVVTGGKTTAADLSSDEDDDDEDHEEKADVTTPQIFENEDSEPQGDPANMEQFPEDLSNASVVQQNIKESKSDSDKLLFDSEDESNQEVTGDEEAQNETFKSTDESIEDQTEENILSADPVSQDDIYINPKGEKLDNETHEPTEEKADEVSKHLDLSEEESHVQDSIVVPEQVLDGELDKNKTVTDQELAISESGQDTDQSTEKRQSEDPDFKGDKIKADEMHNHLVPDVESNSSFTGLSVEDLDIHESSQMDEREAENYAETKEEEDKEGEELLEDENALSFSESDYVYSDKPSPETTQSTPETQYSDSIMRLTLLRDHFTEDNIERVQKILGLQNLFKVEAMFSDLDTELQVTRLSGIGTTQDIENALERILETSENAILDEIEKMLDSRDTKKDFDQKKEASSLDEETELLDDFQELAFSLRQKYSTVSDSAPLATDKSDDRDEPQLTVEEDVPHVVEEKFDTKPETDHGDNLTVTDHEEGPDVIEKEVLEEVPTAPDVNVEEDSKHFNKNKDLLGLGAVVDMQKAPQTTLETPLDMGLVAEVEHSSSGSMDPIEPVTEKHEEEVGLLTTGTVYMGCIFSIIKNKTAEWAVVAISLLPEEWRPGETLFGCPWEVVVTTSFVGVLTFTLFFWRTVLAVKKRKYLVDEKKLKEQIQALKKEKNEALAKISQLKEQTEELRENQNESKETVSCTMKNMQDLESKMIEAEKLNEQMAEERKEYAKLLEEERAASLQNETRIGKLEKSNEKLQLSRKKTQEALAKTTALLDEAKIREDARNAQHKCLQKEYTALKEENKTLKATIKGWEDKHKELNEKIKVYQKSQKELEDSVVLKDHNVEVLSELLADLEACDAQKGDTKVLANGELAPVSLTDKKTAIRNRIKLMMDVSRVQTTLAVVEEERDRFMAKLLNEEKSRKEQEEKHRELEHEIGTIKSEKSHIENQFKILQQKNEIMVEMYQQKENALQQRLTKEELERRSKENLLSEVGGKALEAEEQVKILRQRINEMEEQMKKTEEVYKEQIKEQENKTHSNWVNARNAERALSQEKLEASKLREKLAVLTSQLNERRAPLFRPNSGQPGGPRQGDSYGPSPVSGGAPSPPLMIEGPRRPPSAPVGRRIDPYGPRPPSDPHGRYAENKHIPGMDMMGPRSSSPANLDGSTQAVDPQIKAETQAVASTESPEPGPGSFMASPIRDSPGGMVQGPQPGPGVHDPLLPPGPHGRLPPPGPYRSPRPGHYQLPPGALPPNVPPPLPGPRLPPNGHPGIPPPGAMGGDFGPRPANGLAFHPRPGPGPVMDPRGPPPPHFRPPPHHFGPIPPPHGVRGPLGPRPPFPPDMRFPGVPPHPTHPGDGYGQTPPNALQNSAGGQSGPGQDLHVKQEASQDSARPAMAKP